MADISADSSGKSEYPSYFLSLIHVIDDMNQGKHLQNTGTRNRQKTGYRSENNLVSHEKVPHWLYNNRGKNNYKYTFTCFMRICTYFQLSTSRTHRSGRMDSPCVTSHRTFFVRTSLVPEGKIWHMNHARGPAFSLTGISHRTSRLFLFTTRSSS